MDYSKIRRMEYIGYKFLLVLKISNKNILKNILEI